MKPERKILAILLSAIALFSSTASAKCAPDYLVGIRPMVMAFSKTKENQWVKSDKCLKSLWKYVSKNNLNTEIYNTALMTIHNALQTGAHNFETSQCSVEFLMMLKSEEDEADPLLEEARTDLQRCMSPTKEESEERGIEMSDEYDSPLVPISPLKLN